MCSRFFGSHVTVTRHCFLARKGTAQMQVWYVPPHARRLSAIQSCMRVACWMRPGKLPNKGQTRGPLSERVMNENHIKYAAIAVKIIKAFDASMCFVGPNDRNTALLGGSTSNTVKVSPEKQRCRRFWSTNNN